MYVEVTDLSQTSPNGEGETTEVVIGFIPQYQVYTGVVWAGYEGVGSGLSNIGTNSTIFPCNNFSPLFYSPSPFPGLSATPPFTNTPPGNQGLTKKGSIANWTNVDVSVYFAIEAPQTAPISTDAKIIRGTGSAGFIQANTYNDAFNTAPVVFPWGGNVLKAWNGGSVPSVENEQMAHNISLTLESNGITGSPNGRYGLVFRAYTGGPPPGNWSATNDVLGVPIVNPPWPYNQDGDFNNRAPWLNP